MVRPRRRATLVLCALGLSVPGPFPALTAAAASGADDVPDRWSGRPGLLADLDGRSTVPVPMPQVDPLEPGGVPMPRARTGTRAVPIPEAEAGTPRPDPPGPGPAPGSRLAPPPDPRIGPWSGTVTDPRRDAPLLGPPLRDSRPQDSRLRDPRLP